MKHLAATLLLSLISLVELSAAGVHPLPTTGESERSRIAWDYSTLVQALPNGNYGRMIELSNGELVVVAGSRGGVALSRSRDKGVSWSSPKIVAPSREGISMSVPEIIELKSGELLLSYNPRPHENNSDGELKYGMRVRLSSNRGESWGDEIFVFDAGSTKEVGCWEPFTLQLPSGEIQLYFANEAEFDKSNEQNISMCRSTDGGKSWSSPEVVSFRPKFRDGMPSAIYLQHSGETIVAIEDNGYAHRPRRMTPSIVRTTDDWKSGAAETSSQHRNEALVGSLQPADNGAAPYICLAPSGEVLMSYQGSEGRDVPINAKTKVKTNDYSQEMYVAVGDRNGRDFTNRSRPFRLPLGAGGRFPADGKGYQGLWNSIVSLDDGSIWALTSTNAFKRGIYAIKGYLLGDITPKTMGRRVKIDEGYPQIVVAHTLPIQLYGWVGQDAKNIYFNLKIRGGVALGDQLTLDFAREVVVDMPLTNISATELPVGAKCRSKQTNGEVTIECSIPRSSLPFDINGEIAINATLRSGNRSESIPHSDNQPSSWLKIKTK